MRARGMTLMKIAIRKARDVSKRRLKLAEDYEMTTLVIFS